MCISVVLMFFSQRLDETKKKKDFIFLIWIIFLRKSYQTHDTHYLSLLLISFLSRQKKLYVFFWKGKNLYWFQYSNDKTTDQKETNAVCILAWYVNQRTKISSAMKRLWFWMSFVWNGNQIWFFTAFAERTGEGDRERERRKREVRKRGEREGWI